MMSLKPPSLWGKFVFGSGQKPPPSFHWGKELAAIDNCPKHKTTYSTDVFGRAIVCLCGYHNLLPPPTQQTR